MKTMNQQIIHFLVMLLVIGGAFVQSNASAANNEQAEQLFVRRVAPLFHEKCLACHGKDESQIKGGGNKGVRNEWHCRLMRKELRHWFALLSLTRFFQALLSPRFLRLVLPGGRCCHCKQFS